MKTKTSLERLWRRTCAHNLKLGLTYVEQPPPKDPRWASVTYRLTVSDPRAGVDVCIREGADLAELAAEVERELADKGHLG